MYVLLLSKTSAEETQESVYCELCSVHIQVHTVTFLVSVINQANNAVNCSVLLGGLSTTSSNYLSK